MDQNSALQLLRQSIRRKCEKIRQETKVDKTSEESIETVILRVLKLKAKTTK